MKRPFLRQFSLFAALFLLAAPLAFADNAEFLDEEISNGLIKANSVRTEHFRFEFSNLIADQADDDGDGVPNLVEVTAVAAEQSYDIIIEALGYADPMEDEPFKILIIFDEKDQYLIPGAIGVTSILSNGNPYIALDPWLSEDYLRVTTAHEYFHAVQFGYGLDWAYTDQGLNVAESTATWVEDEVYEDVNDYILYLPDYFDYPDYSVFATVNPSDTLYQYALNVWPRFLSEYYDDEVIREILEIYLNLSEYDDGLEYYNAVKYIVESEGDTLSDVYHEFAQWNLDLENYPDGDLFPSVLLLHDGDSHTDYMSVDEAYAPALYGTNYLYYSNDGGEDEFAFHLVKPEGVSYKVSLVPVDGGDVLLEDAVSLFIDQDEQMGDALTLDGLSSVEELVVIVSALEVDFENEDTTPFDYGYLYNYLGSFEDDLSTAIEVDSELETADDKEGVEASDAEEIRLPDTISLSVVSFDKDSVSFSWNRLVDDAADSYLIEYGTESGEYDMEESVDQVHVTFSTVDGLEEGTTYYFQVSMLDEDGDLLGEASNEIAVTPEAWVFSDISPLHDYFDPISALVEWGIFEGYSDGTFRSDSEINRAELVKIFIEARGIDPDADAYKNCFPDVNDEWFARYVCYAKEQGWVGGYPDGTYKPGESVNKVEALKILFNVYEEGLVEGVSVAELNYTDLDTDAWYAVYVWKASKLGILEEPAGSKFQPVERRTRGEMSYILYSYTVVSSE